MKVLNKEQLSAWAVDIYKNACEHGWHDKPLSPEHYCGLIMTEIAEAVEADRKGRRSDDAEFKRALSSEAKGSDFSFTACYHDYVKGSIEEEFADVVIRLLDMSRGLYGNEMCWTDSYPLGKMYNSDKSFIENAWSFVRRVLNFGTMNISDSVAFMYVWSEHLGIDLDQHIEWKMMYNKIRPYKHGGKKY